MRQELLYTCNKEDLKKTYEAYKAKEPGSLTSQFSDRRNKEGAIRNQAKRKEKITELFRSGWLICFLFLKNNVTQSGTQLAEEKHQIWHSLTQLPIVALKTVLRGTCF